MALVKKYIQGELIKSEDHNLTQRNGVIFSNPVYSEVSGASVYTLSDFTMEQEIFEGLKLKLYIDTNSLGSQLSIKIGDVNYPITASFKADNIYNLVYLNNQFVVEKAGGGGLSNINTLWTGSVSLMNGDFINVTLSNILINVENAGMLIIRIQNANGTIFDTQIPAATFKNNTNYKTYIPFFQGQATGMVYVEVSRTNNDLVLKNSIYTGIAQGSLIKSVYQVL